jgi:hypothetical protein
MVERRIFEKGKRQERFICLRSQPDGTNERMVVGHMNKL